MFFNNGIVFGDLDSDFVAFFSNDIDSDFVAFLSNDIGLNSIILDKINW